MDRVTLNYITAMFDIISIQTSRVAMLFLYSTEMEFAPHFRSVRNENAI